MGSHDNKETFIKEGQTPIPENVKDWGIEEEEKTVVEKEIQRISLQLDKVFDLKNQQATLRLELENLKLEWTHFKSNHNISDGPFYLKRSFSSIRLMKMWVKLQEFADTRDDNSMSFWQWLKWLWSSQLIKYWLHLKSKFDKLFVARYEGKPLNGVIQIFNLFNIRNADLDAALMSSKEAKESVLSTIDEDIEAMRKFTSPIYIGWGSLGKDHHFKKQAEKIFQFVRGEMKQEYLFPEFERNRFYHPQYLMGRGKNKPISQSILKSFCKNSCKMNHDEAYIPSIETISGKEVMDYMKKASKQELWYENIRYRFFPGLQVTFDKKTINIRFDYKKNNGFSIADYNASNEKNTIAILTEEFCYAGPEKVWIGRKKYSDFGHDALSIARNISDELNRISMALRNCHIEL